MTKKEREKGLETILETIQEAETLYENGACRSALYELGKVAGLIEVYGWSEKTKEKVSVAGDIYTKVMQILED